MRRSQSLHLPRGFCAGDHPQRFLGDGIMVRPDDDRASIRACLPDGAQNMAEKRLTTDRVQHFRQRRAHPRSLTGRQYHCKTCPFRHRIFPDQNQSCVLAEQFGTGKPEAFRLATRH